MESHDDQLNKIQQERRELPIFEFQEQIASLVRGNLFCIITGETGSGKSTQIAQFIIDNIKPEQLSVWNKEDIQQRFHLEALGEARQPQSKMMMKVVVTQPRRVAAIQMAKRVSQERGSPLGQEVGYTIRFDDKTNPQKTKIKYVTDGILVRECLIDPDLLNYQAVVLDEAHERSLDTDILFALVKQAVFRRQGTLRLIITSATLKTEKISEYYSNCPLLSVSGRCYPVAIMNSYSPKEQRVESSVNAAIRIHLHEPAGDVLVFLTGFEECEKATKLCFQRLQDVAERKQKQVPPMIIVPLYGSQSADQQAQAFIDTPENCRKIIFATNIAETSLTVKNVGYVIDCGFVKQKMYNPQTGMESLLIVPISKVQAIQRAGRAGRTREGKCLRLYSEQFYVEQMPNQTLPEIKRVNLASTVLTLKNLGIEDVINFDYLDPPDAEGIYQALKQLYYIQAIDKQGRLRNLGREISRFPLEPTYAKALLASKFWNIKEDMTKLVSILSTENIWFSVSKTEEESQRRFTDVKRKFMDLKSDHMTLVNIYDAWEDNRYSDNWCQRNYVQSRSLKQARNIKDQIKDYLSKVRWDEMEKEFEIDKKHKKSGRFDNQTRSKLLRKALGEGFFMNTARRVPNLKEGTYLTVNEGSLVKADRSTSFGMQEYYPDWAIYTEITGTSSSSGSGQMKMCFEIKLSWVEERLPLLKEFDIFSLSGGRKDPVEEEQKKDKEFLKRMPQDLPQDLENKIMEGDVKIKDSKEDKVAALKQRYLKRQKK